MTGLDFVLDRTVTIVARRETVFRYFTDSGRFAAWWGQGSTIEPRPGGVVHIRHPNAIVAGGEVVEIVPPERIVFSYGFESGQPIPVAASRVTITLEETASGTLVKLRHELPNAEVRDEHVQGWRYQLAVFANVVAKEAHAGTAELADRYFACWGETDAAKRRAELAAIASEDLSFRDPYSCTSGIDDLNAHIAASQRFMPGVVLARRGDARQCQGTALVDWVVQAPDGSERAKGTNVFELTKGGRIARATGFWA
ncbi:MAG TPA: SRPBCC domain-containing protein [Vicinamibacteria bacterium]|nr:SRPBCC domain-containing protein [Vicinamibacteria bacterium]